MSYNGDDFLGAMFHDCFGGFDEGTAGVGHVVYENGNFVHDVTDKDHAGYFVRTSAFLVNKGKPKVKAVGYGSCSKNLVSYSGSCFFIFFLFF